MKLESLDLIESINRDDLVSVRLLLEKGPNVNTENGYALACAVPLGNDWSNNLKSHRCRL